MMKPGRHLTGGLRTLLRSTLALLVALLIGGILINLGGYSFIEVYAAIFKGSLGSWRGILLSLATATPIMFTGLGFAIAIRVGIVNTGLEGQLYMGGLAAALAGAYITGLPGLIHPGVAMLAGALAGGAVGLLMGWFRIRFGAPEVITGIMLNSIITFFTGYLSNGPLRPPQTSSPQTAQILSTAELTKLVPRSQLTTAFIVGVVLCVVIYILQKKTVWGYKMEAVGLNPRASKVAGINVSRMYLLALFLSGAMAGLAGGALVLGVLRRFVDVLSNGLGFQGIPVSALAAHNPLAVVVSSILFGILKAGAAMVNQSTRIPYEFVDVVQALVVVFVAAPSIIATPIETLCRGLTGFGADRTASGNDADKAEEEVVS